MPNPIPGTGKRGTAGRFIENPQLLRTVTAPGDADTDSATIAAVPEFIDSKSRPDIVDAKKDRAWGIDNLLHIQVVVPATITSFDLHLFGTMTEGDMVEEDAMWSYIFRQEGFERSQVVTLEQVPPGTLKVLVNNVVGTGDAKVYFALTD